MIEGTGGGGGGGDCSLALSAMLGPTCTIRQCCMWRRFNYTLLSRANTYDTEAFACNYDRYGSTHFAAFHLYETLQRNPDCLQECPQYSSNSLHLVKPSVL